MFDIISIRMDFKKKILSGIIITLSVMTFLVFLRAGYLYYRAIITQKEIIETEKKLQKIREMYRRASSSLEEEYPENTALHIDTGANDFRNLALESELLKLLSLLNSSEEVSIFPGNPACVRVWRKGQDYYLSSALTKKPALIFIPPRHDTISALRQAVIQELRRAGGDYLTK